MSAVERPSGLDERVVGPAIAGATAAAVLVGILEAAVVTHERHLGVDGGLWFFALAFYGFAGLVIGIGAGVALAVLSRARPSLREATAAFALSGAATLSVLVTVIGRFRVFRDVLHETFEGAPISPLTFQLGSAAVAAILLALSFVALRAAGRRQALATSPVLVVGVLVVALAAAFGAMRVTAKGETPIGPARSSALPPPGGPSVILVMVDTLRADHLSCYGYEANRTPAIDTLAADGTVFAHAFSQASWTRPSVATILTSLYPSSHGAVHKSDILSDEVVTLPEVMQARGYHTIGFANNINVAPLFNFQQGFDEYVFLEPEFFFGATESAAQLTLYNQLRLIRERYLSRSKRVQNYYQPADVVTDRALDWITHHGDRAFFMFLHYMEPHDPYFTHPFNGEALARVENPNPDPGLAQRYRAAYDGEITYLDDQLGRLFAELKKAGVYERAMIVLTSDHGEEFYEHGGWWHGTTLYDEQVAVPLIVKPPRGGAAGVASGALVSSVDIAPTILGAAGIAAPDVMVGKPLGLAAGAPAPRDHTFAEQDLEGNVLHAYRSGGWKLIDANRGNPRGLPERQLFEVAKDPHEQRDLLASRPEQAATLAASMAAVRQHAEAVAVRSGETAIDSATEERLRALGYVH